MKIIEEIILEHLNKNLCVPVFMEVPENAPNEYAVIEKTGSGNENGIYCATVAVQSYAQSLYRAAVINECVKSVMSDMIARDDISAVELNSDYNFTDTATKQYRYQAVFDIYY